MVNKVCWISWVHSIGKVHMLLETCEREGRKETSRRYDSTGETQAWAGNAYVEICPRVVSKENVHKLTSVLVWAKFPLVMLRR